MKKVLFFVSFLILLNGCASAYKKNYTSVEPVKYSKTANVRVFEYTEADLDLLQKTVFKDYLVLGRSSFEGTYEDPAKSVTYAQSIGSDFLVTNSIYSETENSYDIRTEPVYKTSVAQIASYGPTTGYGSGVATRTTYTLNTKKIFKQDALFLKNIKNIQPVWDKKETDFPKTGISGFDGIWASQFYSVYVYRSDDNIVAFIHSKAEISIDQNSFASRKAAKNRELYKAGDLKFIFNNGAKTGTFITDELNPYPAALSLNAFGDMVIELPGPVRYSFRKIK